MGKGPAHDVLQVLHLLRWSTHTPCHEKRQGMRWPPQHKQDKVNGEPQGDPTPKSTKKDKGGGKPRGPQNHHGTVSLS